MNVERHSAADFAKMRVAGRVAAAILDLLTLAVRPGVSTSELDELAVDIAHSLGATHACLGYHGYPKSICTSVNSLIVHGIPDTKTVLECGDVLNIDVTCIVDGWHGDTSRMFWVGGHPSPERQAASRLAYLTTWQALRHIQPGATLRQLGYVMERTAARHGGETMHDFLGHGIGREFHTEPYIHPYGGFAPAHDLILEPGMFFTVEPTVVIGGTGYERLADGWGIRLTDPAAEAATFEHTIGVRENGVEIFTASPARLDTPWKANKHTHVELARKLEALLDKMRKQV